MCYFWVQNAPFVLNKKSSVKIVNITSIYILTPFSVQIFKKLLRGDPELWQWTISGSKLVHLPLTRTFLGKLLILFSSTYWTLSLCKILKNSYNGSRVIRMCHFWTQNGLFVQTNFFFRKTLFLSFMPICIPKECWNLTGQESLLAINWESFFSQACSFFLQNVKEP